MYLYVIESEKTWSYTNPLPGFLIAKEKKEKKRKILVLELINFENDGEHKLLISLKLIYYHSFVM